MVNMRGYGSAYLWAYRKVEERAARYIEELAIEEMKALIDYEKGICGYCPQMFCVIDKMIECYETFKLKGVVNNGE